MTAINNIVCLKQFPRFVSAAGVAMFMLTMACGEPRRTIEVGGNSDVKTSGEQNSADTTSTKGIIFINPVTNLEVGNEISQASGSNVKIGVRLVGVRGDDYTVGFAKGSSGILQIQNGFVVASAIPAGVHTLKLVARATRACLANQTANSIEVQRAPGGGSAPFQMRCDIKDSEVQTSSFDYDIVQTFTVKVSGSSGSQTLGTGGQQNQNSNEPQTITDQFGGSSSSNR
jgi:hypothetical protein